MSLLAEKILILDCQTTGMRPSQGSMLEFAWSWVRAGDSVAPMVESHLIRLSENQTIPRRVQEITGIEAADLNQALELTEVKERFFESLKRKRGDPTYAAIHYAQFERPFLAAWFTGGVLPFEVVCTYQLSRILFPNLPSRNIRGLCGYFSGRVGEIKRADAHVRATIEIWRGLARELQARGVERVEEIPSWLKANPSVKKKIAPRQGYDYRVDREKRLRLPEGPGVYRMISKSGEVLYVGKATSLKDRVNSYFRGKKGRNKRKLEMISQVWDLQVTETRSAVEAAILESDEIKKHNPPYNVSLKAGKRRLVYFSRDFLQIGSTQNHLYPIGPFRRFNNVLLLNPLFESISSGVFQQVFYQEIPLPELENGWRIFLKRNKIEMHKFKSVRSLLALGCRLRKIHAGQADEVEDPHAEMTARHEELDTEEALSSDEIADKFARLLMRAAGELLRARKVTQLLNARVRWRSLQGWHELEIRGGHLAMSEATEVTEATEGHAVERFPWSGLDIADFDRMSILASEISRRPYEIEPR